MHKYMQICGNTPLVRPILWGNAANPAAGLVVLFKITLELTGINENDVNESQFAAPAGWKKVKPQAW